MRAPGHPQSCLLTDCPLDDLAAKLGLDPMQVRLKNLPQNDPDAVKNAPQSFTALRNTIYTEEIEIAARAVGLGEALAPAGQGAGQGPIKHGIGMALHTWGGRPAAPTTSRSPSAATAACWSSPRRRTWAPASAP